MLPLFLGKSTKLLSPELFFWLKYASNRSQAGTLLQTPRGLTLPSPLSRSRGGAPEREGNEGRGEGKVKGDEYQRM